MGLFSRHVPTAQEQLDELTSQGWYPVPFDNLLVRDLSTEQFEYYLERARHELNIYLTWWLCERTLGQVMSDQHKMWLEKTGVELFVIQRCYPPRLPDQDPEQVSVFDGEMLRLIGVLASLLDQTTDQLRAMLCDAVGNQIAAFGYAEPGGW